MQICVLGGDVRMDHVAAALQKRGHLVTRTDQNQPGEVLILPIRYTTDGLHVSGTRVAVHDAIGQRRLIFGGLPPAQAPLAHVQNYAADEWLLQENARLTAEGAVVLLAGQLDRALYGADIGVLGMGRIATFLCRMLSALGADVTVYARKEAALQRACEMGARAVSLADTLPVAAVRDHDALLNTVPSLILGGELLSHSRPGLVYLELASAPGGIDRAAAERMGVIYIDGQGLPGKYAPRSAGELIAAYVSDYLTREGEL